MDIGPLAQSCANAYHSTGEQNGWRKGRNSSRGYDRLTAPSAAWDDGPHDRYLLLVNQHLSSGAAQLDACGACVAAGNVPAAATLARAVFVESSKVSWLLEAEVAWTARAARAHLELLHDLDTHVRRLPKRLESGHPNFRRKHWQGQRKQFRDNVIEKLFGKQALTRDRDEPTLDGQALLSSALLEEQFAEQVSIRGSDGALDTTTNVDPHLLQHSLLVALTAWLRALDAWVRYNGWETATVVQLGKQLEPLCRSAPC